MEWQWNADAFDAIHLIAPNGEFEIIGTDNNQVIVQDDNHNQYAQSNPVLRGRWLDIQPAHGASEWTIELPKSKAWVIEIASGSGEIEIENVHAHLQVQLGSGDMHIANCRGTFSLQSGSGDIEIENCVQADVPAVPEFSHAEPEAARESIPPIPPMPPAGKKARAGKYDTIPDEQEWEQYGREWEEWGNRFASQATRWAEKFAREVGNNFGFGQIAREPGMHIRLASGDVDMEQIDAQTVSVGVSSGDVNMQDGRIGALRIEASRSDMSIENILPAGDWDVSTRHGDIQIVLPDDTNARIDAATRHGDIESDVPLVGVGRPGRAARHGGRMVGTIGQVSDTLPELHFESLHGDIEIEMTGRSSPFAGQTDAPRKTKRAAGPIPPIPPVPPIPPIPPMPDAFGFANTREFSSADDAPQPSAQNNAPAYDSHLAVLQALQKGEITVAEAETLLKSLG